jgi:hypothetical protein
MHVRSFLLPPVTVGVALFCAVTAGLAAQVATRGTDTPARRTSCAPPPVRAAGDLELRAIRPDTEIPSRNWQTPTTVTFVNGSCDTVSIIWVDYYGRRKPYKVLPPGATHEQKTFVDNTWVIETSSPARPVGYFRSTASSSRAVIRERRTEVR